MTPNDRNIGDNVVTFVVMVLVTYIFIAVIYHMVQFLGFFGFLAVVLGGAFVVWHLGRRV